MPYTIPRRVYDKFIAPHKEWQAMKFINHGLGLMRLEEHQTLVREGVIHCYRNEGSDAIISDYPMLAVAARGDDERLIDMGGDLFQLTQERDLNMKNHIRSRILFFPRKFTRYLESRQSDHAAEQRQALEAIAKDFGGEVVDKI